MNTTTSIGAADASQAPGYEPRKSNYLVRHWRGALSLGISYWLNGALIGNVLPLAIIAAAAASEKSDSGNLRLTSALSLIGIVFSLFTFVWASVGIWRSAGHHVQRGGKSGWATAAKAMVLLSLVSMAGRFGGSNLGAQMFEFWQIAAGHDPMGRIVVTVSPDGQSVLLQGAMGEGSARNLKRILDANSGIKLVELKSNGGRLYEARVIANDVRARGLDTYVEDACASACTLVFLAGRDRGATPNARIGFHRPSFAGRDDENTAAGREAMMSAYRAAGISDAFIAIFL